MQLPKQHLTKVCQYARKCRHRGLFDPMLSALPKSTSPISLGERRYPGSKSCVAGSLAAPAEPSSRRRSSMVLAPAASPCWPACVCHIRFACNNIMGFQGSAAGARATAGWMGRHPQVVDRGDEVFSVAQARNAHLRRRRTTTSLMRSHHAFPRTTN